jgi:hypothetical protein
VGSDAAANFTLTVSKYECPRNCSSHGACVPANDSSPYKRCACDEGFGGRDCSKAAHALEYGRQIHQDPAAFEVTYFSLPPLTGALEAARGALLPAEPFLLQTTRLRAFCASC